MSDFRVIEILDKKSILINMGKKDGAKRGDIVEIYEVGDKIIDPKTSEVIGTYDNIKDTLKITEVFDKFSVCKNILTERVSLIVDIPNLISKEINTEMNLCVDESAITNRKKSDNKMIMVNDYVRLS